ncbi:MAG: FAD-dependent oxidoreductase [Proteobacteria bacterium]|nr:FAD-dependent oxidoreductase [Pseudomonadota bacterium]
MKESIKLSSKSGRRFLTTSLASAGVSGVVFQSKKEWEQYNSEDTLPKVASASESIREFAQGLKNQSKNRYVEAREGLLWRTKNPELNQVLDSHFSDMSEAYGISSGNDKKDSPVYSDVSIKSDSDVETKSFRQESAANVSAGGYPALWSAYIQSVLYKKGMLPKDSPPPVYVMPENMKNSAYYGSSTQFHVSHASPMYTDSEFSTTNILFATAKRNLFPLSSSPEKDNYMVGEIHPSAMLKPDVLRVGLGYLFHEMKYKYQSKFSKTDVTDETMPLAVASGNVLDEVGADIGKPLLIRNNTIRVAYDEKETKEMVDLKKVLKKYGVDCEEITFDKAKEIAGTIPSIGKGGSIWSVKGDGNMVPNVVDMLTEGIKNNGGIVIEGTVKDVLYNKDEGKVSGVVVENSKDKQKTLIKTDKLFTSFGARAKYSLNKSVPVKQHVEPIISGTGYSAFLLVEGKIEKPIDSNNSHFTPVKTVTTKDGKDLSLVKTTCGGAIGTDSFCVDHAINNLHYATEVIFPGKKVDILTAKSCSRPLNGKNSEIITEVIPGFYAATGFGGKGVTDAPGFAVKHVAQKLAGDRSDQEKVKKYIDRFSTKTVNTDISTVDDKPPDKKAESSFLEKYHESFSSSSKGSQKPTRHIQGR